MKTNLLFYPHPQQYSCTTAWEPRSDVNSPNVLAVAETVAFAESGGQCPDHGTVCQGEIKIPFTNVQKAGVGRVIYLPDYPAIQVEKEIQIHLEGDISQLDPTSPITMEIDPVRRGKLTRSHTAAHLVYLALKVEFPDMFTKGCYIEETKGRFDICAGGGGEFKVEAATLERMNRFIEAWVAADYAVTTESLPDEPEVRTWFCNGERIPCGGTHLTRTGTVGRIQLSRKSKGPVMERVQYALLDEYQTE